jgi:hypothetical protein
MNSWQRTVSITISPGVISCPFACATRASSDSWPGLAVDVLERLHELLGRFRRRLTGAASSRAPTLCSAWWKPPKSVSDTP